MATNTSTQQIVSLAAAYAESTGRAISTVSLHAAGQGHLIRRLSAGHDITTRRAGRIVQWFSDHWPADLDWPSGIRPAPSPDSPAGAPEPPPDDPVAAVKEEDDKLDAAMLAGDWDAARRHEARKFRAAMVLRDDGRIASVEALCLSLGVGRDVYQDVVRRYADGRGGGRPRNTDSDTGRMLRALVMSGDVRFSERRAA